MKKVMLLMIAAGACAGAIALAQKKRRTEHPVDSARPDQETGDGTPVVEEWGEESFPASDPPQSW